LAEVADRALRHRIEQLAARLGVFLGGDLDHVDAGITEVLVHTGQHFDAHMSDVFFDELQMPPPAHHLGIAGGGHGDMTGRMLIAIERVLLDEKPDVVLVYGDTNSTLAGAIARQGSAAAILATGNSQIRFLKKLVELGGVDWSKVTLFHMDEYLGISADHPASVRYYMKERVESLVKPKAFHYIHGDCDLPHV
jgi:hypothetical protein